MIAAHEADGILCTEQMVQDSDTMTVHYPEILEPQLVRAAHYNIAFHHVRENFAISGLQSFVKVKYINKSFQFEGN